MPAGMDVGEYDRYQISGNALALEVAGRPMNDTELEMMFAGEGDAMYESFMAGSIDLSYTPPPPDPPAVFEQTQKMIDKRTSLPEGAL